MTAVEPLSSREDEAPARDPSGARTDSVPSVTGSLGWQVWVDCPHCGETVDLADEEDDDYLLAGAVFGCKAERARWDNPGTEHECPECGGVFALGKIKY